MTNEEKRIKLAEHLGWTGPFGWGRPSYPDHEGIERQGFVGTDPDGDIEIVPNYFGDLNAIHDAEKTLRDDALRDKMSDALMLTANDAFPLWHASASERTEALGQSLGLWTAED